MSFYEKVKLYKNFDFEEFLKNVTVEKIRRILNKDHIDEKDFLCLLSPAAANCLEEMAEKAHEISLRNFGKSVVLYTPMYLANYCENKCIYCSYNAENHINRKKLTFEELEKEAKAIYDTGLRHIIILTGESRYHTPVSYIADCVTILKKYFSSICIEVYALEEEEYRELIEVGVDSLTIYQEVYNEEIYKKVHLAGPKKDYKYRLDAPERAARAGIHSLSVGALLGLDNWRQEAFFSGLHVQYIQEKYPSVEVTMSIPRIRPHVGSFNGIIEVSDKEAVQILLAYKIFIQRAGINITTRERAEFRDNLIPLGVTKISAGVSTEVGGHSTEQKGGSQFDIADNRTVEEMKIAINNMGYNAVFKDWQRV
ncbi:2-iminoacetate synthase ThiH [Clostridium botulinum]|uniref:Thiamine biosynthesis protein ThiH n=1 Tax=Clostridium botulinum TaxID=1491 RepID=A0A9Q1UX60_CLOBO|nr:2-iminoacetate synthase ThiH [Clostridium botulinum]AEB75358.1 thiazole biosynthesis protein ThiH [Clostridium botulinum BKT015925]KEI02344.1 thiamine biosynthesis protein ThiH [Clostridium botulinum D str. 16868]KEI03947.1 thiamine biosynthesis protein ThiH [Clostridium botulinum C/D str. Sp77]KLU77110.1 thiamine biosynthesis protein ThiH [Clostridium botulinum V891]KOA73547.1 thiamine biosynthesis protein ThiH [Clostridium botulinum]